MKPSISTVRHPDAVVRRLIRVLRMLSELHVGGFQRLRAMPYLTDGLHWRLVIRPRDMFHTRHGALQWDPTVFLDGWMETASQIDYAVAHFTTGGLEEGLYFDWADASNDDARGLAAKFVERFSELARRGEGWDYEYAGWFQRVIGLAEQGWIPVAFEVGRPALMDRLYLHDLRPAEWREAREGVEPVLPLPPPGDLDRPWFGA